MFIIIYLTIFLILFSEQTTGVKNLNHGDDIDTGWGLYLSVSQGNDQLPSYDIEHWTRQLHLQQCAFVEIGEEFCALFVELRSISSTEKIFDSSGVSEFFLGLCKCATVRSWILCSDQLMRRRKSDCVFTEAVPTANTSARVHRRLCDVTLLTEYAEPCNCSIPMANQQLYRTKGFPTCFLTPLPESLCSPRGVCGVAQCCTTTIKGVHSPQCDPECHQRQPFCEELGPWTSIPPQITSLWSHWSTPVCQNSHGRIFSTSTTTCRNQVTGKPAIDCIGPGSFCCPANTERCTCIVTNEDGILKATRIIESTPCILNFKRDRAKLFKETDPEHKEYDVQRFDNPDHFYQDTLEESREYQSYSEYEEPTNPLQRRLMFSSYDYAENHDRFVDRDVEFADGDDESEDGNDDDNGDEDEDQDQDQDQDQDENEDEDLGEDDDGEIEENEEEDSYGTESSETDDYVHLSRELNMRESYMKWTIERSPKLFRRNPSVCVALPKRQNIQLMGNPGFKCENEWESTGIESPLVYSQLDSDSSDDGEKSGDEDDGDVSSLAIVGQILKPYPFYHLSVYICIALYI